MTSCPPRHPPPPRPSLSFPGPLSGCVVPTVWRPAPPHSRDHQRPRYVRPQALRQDQPREGENANEPDFLSGHLLTFSSSAK